jgi:3-phosphoshikimate 1-carboxyvinyltransferase
MTERIAPAQALSGAVRLPGDKSISHRYAIIAALAEGSSTIANYSTGNDCQSTLSCLEALGVKMERPDNSVSIHGRGLRGLKEPVAPLDAGNSGSTIRMLSGVLAAQPFTTRIGGDESLSKRPMARIMKPLREMGVPIEARDGQYPPLEIHGGKLAPVDYTLPVASAQVKTCILFAGLFAEGTTTVREPVRTRDHTEIALREFGGKIRIDKGAVSVTGPAFLKARDATVPGDLSSAAFFIVAALLIPGSEILIRGVGLNPTRSELIDVLVSMGADIRIANVSSEAGELTGDLAVRYSRLEGGTIEGPLTAALIDEIPALAVLGTATRSGIAVKDAAELRIKETDRIAAIAENLSRMGVDAEVHQDGMRVPGGQRLRAAELESYGDHRIAMAFSVAALASTGECTIRDSDAAAVSFPEFYAKLRELIR